MAWWQQRRTAVDESQETEEIGQLSVPLDDPASLDRLIERFGDARFVLLGEASHGTAEYYACRAAITQRLITERGFSFVAVEGDWPDCFSVNRWVKGREAPDVAAADVLATFSRWPTWMWANTEVESFIEWLRDWNGQTGGGVGFYGLDVYSLWESLERVASYLHEDHAEAFDAAVAAFRCFEPYHEDPQRYAWASRMVPASCEHEVVELLREVSRQQVADGDPEAQFDAVQNAEVLAGAEEYYRAMVRADETSWNVRDCHMSDTLDRLMAHHGESAKAIVWAHNTHVGDARATDMASAGMVNLGQVARERHGPDDVYVVGFGGYDGGVIAAGAWGARMREMEVPPARPGTHEDLLHRTVGGDALLVFPDDRSTRWLDSSRGHRAIGVVYHPERDRHGNWVPTVMGRRYDAFVYFEHTSALHPLPAEPALAGEQETYPWNV